MIIFLPLETRRSVVIIGAFFVGLFIDLFYDSIGVHTAALVLTGFLRTPVLQLVEPRQGYRNGTTLSGKNYGLSWIMIFTAIMLLGHILAYYSIDAFTFVFFLKIIVSTILTFLVSYIIILLYKSLVQ